MVVGERNTFFPLYEALDISGPIVIGRHGKSEVAEVENELRKIVNSNSYIEKGIKKSLVSHPLNTHFLSNRLGDIGHDLH